MRTLRIFAIAQVVWVAQVVGLATASVAADAPAGEAAPGAHDVEILRDPYGVPHIYGRTDADVAYGLAWAHAEDDFETLEEVILLVRGRLAREHGREAATSDYLVQLLGVRERVETQYTEDLSPAVRAVCEAYAAGIDAYARGQAGTRIADLLPVTGHDIVVGFALRQPFFYGLGQTLSHLFAGRPPGGVQTEAAAEVAGTGMPFAAPRMGSNAVAVAPVRAADGATRLLVNSHQPYDGPVAWYEVRLHSEEGWDMAGGVFPGSPFVLHGHNRNFGWAATVNRPDLIDVYELELDPDDDTRYRFDGAWRRLEVGEARIPVKLLGPLRWTVTRETLRSLHGPVLRTDAGTFAIRYAGADDIRQVEQYYRMNKAHSLEEWEAALRMQALPSLNLVYADRTGRIGYVYNAAFPKREPGFDWAGVLPGDTSAAVWTETLPYETAPHIREPASGYVVSANHTPFRATDPADDLDPAAFAPELGVETQMTNRARRALALYGGDTAITREAFRRYKFDKRYADGSDVVRLATQLLAADATDDPLLREAQDVLRAWDRSAHIASRGAALALGAIEPVVEARRRGRPAPDPVASLRRTAETLRATFGRLDPAWGRVQRIQRGGGNLAIGGGPDLLRAVESEIDADGRRGATGGDGLIVFVEWDAEGRLRSESLHQWGSALGVPESVHYDDQVAPFVAESPKPIVFDETEARARASEQYRPGARGR